MAERKKPLSTTHDHEHELRLAGRKVKRARLTRSTSRPLDNDIAPSDPPSSKVHSRSQSEVVTSSAHRNGEAAQSVLLPSRLPELLDFSAVSSHKDIAYRFGQIARSLLHDHTLVVTSQSLRAEYELLEVEFYLRKEGHEDPFAHASSEQSESGKWYFHRAPQKSEDPTRSATSLTGYRGGSRKGVDLTFGGPVSSSFFVQDVQTDGSAQRPRGGILFRSMRRLSDGAVISGPSLLVDELLRVCRCTSIAELVGETLAKDTSAFPSLTPNAPRDTSISIRPRPTALSKKLTVYSSPRIGLDLSHPGVTTSPTDPRVTFIQKPYRYFLNPALLTANGRPQTFLGIYNLLSEAEILNESGVLDEVYRLTGMKRASAEKYAAEFQQGRKSGKIENFIGSAGKGASSSPLLYLRMMGTLARSCAS